MSREVHGATGQADDGARERGNAAPLTVAVLIPARDEEEALPGLLAALRSAPVGEGAALERMLVVDNGSSDATAAVAREGGAQVVREPRAGYGRACLRGLRALAGAERPPEVVAFLDADDHRGPGQLHRILTPLERGEADLVVGARTPAGQVPRHAAAGNLVVTTILRGVYGWRGRDMGPLRAMELRALLRLRMDDPDYGWNVQMLVRALRARLRVVEVPVAFSARRYGRSKISGSWGASVRAGATMLRVLARELVRKRAGGGAANDGRRAGLGEDRRPGSVPNGDQELS